MEQRKEKLLVDVMQVELASKYLVTRETRLHIEQQSGKFNVLPRRLIEIVRGRRLAKTLGIKFADQAETDERLPDIAREILSSGRVI